MKIKLPTIDKLKQTARRILHQKPSFMIVGAQKSGTTALHQMLNHHHSLKGSTKKEVGYFSNDSWYNTNNSLRDYHSFFSFPSLSNSHTFESTPIYLYHPQVAKRIRHYNPEMKIIILLRNPVERALSAWTMYHHHFQTGVNQHLHDPRSFSEAIHEELSLSDQTTFYSDPIAYAHRGVYANQVERYIKAFPEKQILILESGELKNNWKNTSASIFEFLEVENTPIPQKKANSSKAKGLDTFDETLNTLKDFYKPYNESLFQLLGTRYDWN